MSATLLSLGLVSWIFSLAPTCERHPQIARLRACGKLKTRGHDSDDCVWESAQRDGAPNDIPVGIEVRMPKAVAEDCHMPTRPVFFGKKAPAQLRLHAQQ